MCCGLFREKLSRICLISCTICSEGKVLPLFSSYRETVSSDFMAACQFLQDHMDNMENPSYEMVRKKKKKHPITLS